MTPDPFHSFNRHLVPDADVEFDQFAQALLGVGCRPCHIRTYRG